MIKHLLLIYLFLVSLVGSITLVFYYSDTTLDFALEKGFFEANEKTNIDLYEKFISDDLKSVVSDLIFLAAHKEIQQLLENNKTELREYLSEEFFLFTDQKNIYDHIRIIDKKGMEVIRVNYNNGNTTIVPEDQLQYKEERYYFIDIFELRKGEVYISSFDLNIEEGKIETPLKPMIRFGTPVFDQKDVKIGLVIINYLGENILKKIKRMPTNIPDKVMLLNPEGYWLYGAKPIDEWGFMYKDRKDRRFGKKYQEAWQQISQADSGQFYNKAGLYTFSTLYPALEGWKSSQHSGAVSRDEIDPLKGKDYYWKIVSYMDPESLNITSEKLLKKLYLVFAVLTIFALIIYRYLDRQNII